MLNINPDIGKNMNIIGITTSHCSSAALMMDGRVVGAVQEERLTQRKNQNGFAKCAIERLLDMHLGGDITRVDEVVFGGRGDDPYWIALDRYSNFTVQDHVQEMHDYWYPHFYEELKDDDNYWKNELRIGRHLGQDHNLDFSFLDTRSGENALRYFNDVERVEAFNRHFDWQGPTTAIDHHKSHAYYALYGAPISTELFSEALVLTADAMGDNSNWSVSVVKPDGILEPLAWGLDHAVARLYKFVTLILGMKPNEHEYKVMGLSSYAPRNKFVLAAEKVFFEALDFRDGKFVSDVPLVDSYFDLKRRLEGHRFDIVAAAVQNWSTDVTRSWIRHWIIKSGRSGVCFSGGLSMNIKTNGDILGMPEVSWLSVPPSGGDESISLGACYAVQAEKFRAVKPLEDAYLGDDADDWDSDWIGLIEKAGGSEKDFDLRNGIDTNCVARLLANDCIVARCSGRAEFGARALGNRSILANPSNPSNLKLINEAIKNRDFWMPFTPSIMEEYSDRYLINPKQAYSPYMTIGFHTNVEYRQEIIAALHPADFTARPQFVSRVINRDYWMLIEEFRKISGIPALLNTSLNLHGDPMNYTIEDCIRTLVCSELNFLVLPNNQLLLKRRATEEVDRALSIEPKGPKAPGFVQKSREGEYLNG